MRSEPDQVLTVDCEKARLILPFPTLGSMQFYAIKANEKSCGRFAMTYIAYANGTLSPSMLSFLSTLLLYDTFLFSKVLLSTLS